MTDVIVGTATSATRESSSCIDWLIDNAETFERLLDAIRGAQRSIHIAQLAFDPDCAAYQHAESGDRLPPHANFAETLIRLAAPGGPKVRILLNASWMLNTARPLRKFFARRGVPEECIEVRGFSRFPHFMHAKLVLIDSNEAFLLGSPFVNSYWDDPDHTPFHARRPQRELGGRPLHDISVYLRGSVVAELESVFAHVWGSCGADSSIPDPSATPIDAPTELRVVCDAPDSILPGVEVGATRMLPELLAGIARARSFIYIEHQYLTSRPIVAAIANALRRTPELEIVIVINQNPDLTAYRAWQNAQLEEHRLLSHPRVGVFSLWSTDRPPESPAVTRISQLFIHSKVMIVDDTWAAVGTSNLDGVSMGDYGDDFASTLGKRVFRGVRNVEVNVVLEGDEHTAAIIELRERLWSEHLGARFTEIRDGAPGEWLAHWRAAARINARALSCAPSHKAERARRVHGRVLPYSTRAFPSEQLRELGITLDPNALQLCYDPNWISVHASLHWIRNIFG